MRQQTALPPEVDSLVASVESVFATCILPSLSVSGITIAPTASLSFEVWNCLRLLPYEARYRIYNYVANVSAAQAHPAAHFSRAAASLEASRQFLRRLVKENCVQQAHLLGKLTHANPIAVFSKVIEQCEAYGNIHDLVISATKNVTQLSLDVWSFLLVQRLSSPRARTKVSLSLPFPLFFLFTHSRTHHHNCTERWYESCHVAQESRRTDWSIVQEAPIDRAHTVAALCASWTRYGRGT